MSIVRNNLITSEHLKSHCILHKNVLVAKNVYIPFTLIVVIKRLYCSYLPSEF